MWLPERPQEALDVFFFPMELMEHAASQPLISSHPLNCREHQSSRSFSFGCRVNERQAAVIAAVYTIVSILLHRYQITLESQLVIVISWVRYGNAFSFRLVQDTAGPLSAAVTQLLLQLLAVTIC